MKLRLAIIAATCAALALPAAAMAEDTAPAPAGAYVVGFQVVSVDAGAGTATGVLHCVGAKYDGRQITFSLAPGVDPSALTPGATVGISLEAGKIAGTQAAPCDAQVGAPTQPGADDPASPTGDTGQGRHDNGNGDARPNKGAGPARFMPGFQNRVWRFVGSADGFDSGQLSFTIDKVLNLPKRFASQDDGLVDQDARALVGDRTRIRNQDGSRATTADLDNANDVRVEGKLLPPKKWVTDQDGQPVPTIRAKRIVILD